MAPGQSPEMLHRQQYHPSVIPSAPNMAPPAMRPPTIENIGPEAMSKSQQLPEFAELLTGGT